MIKSFASLGAAVDAGKVHYQYVTKTALPAPTSTTAFVDANLSSGHPIYNPFVGSPLTFTSLVGQKNEGIYVGNFLPNHNKYLLRFQALSVNIATNMVHLCDYLGFYPTVDGSDLGLQEMDNTTTLPRYQNSTSNRAILIATAPMFSTAPITVTYTNGLGQSGKTVTFNLIAASIGMCATGTGSTGAISEAAVFMPMADQFGISSIQSVQFGAEAGGFLTIAIVHPIAQINCIEAAVPVEETYGLDKHNPPQIFPGAYLNFIMRTSSVAAANFQAELIFINS